ncbi:interferon regulatory factor 2-like [Anneissia japonica]|uniref:interferon regulatory factor 2-like n=1 Tax=Anneissia japonica TaxID=1529436 RepID=UPI0014256841|nr:interferon regulatory factor 2-like [Anneissia japonica]
MTFYMVILWPIVCFKIERSVSIDEALLYRSCCRSTGWKNIVLTDGKYNPETDRARPKTWKANFRCAINSLPDIVEIKDLGTKRGNNAFKVYKINPKRPKARPKQKIVTSESTTAGPTTSLPKRKPPRKPPAQVISQRRNEIAKTTAMSWVATPSYQTTPSNDLRSGWQQARYPPILLTPSEPHQTTTPVYTQELQNQYSPPYYADHSWPTSHIKPEPLPSRHHDTYVAWTETEHDQNSDCSSAPTDEEIIQMTLDMQENSPISSPTSYEQTDWVPSTFGDKQYLSNELTVTRTTAMTSPLKVQTTFPTSTSPPAYPSIKSERDSRCSLFGNPTMTGPPAPPPPPPPYRPTMNYPQIFQHM